MKAIIAGGGIGGLTAALCLHHIGWEAVVLEQAPSVSDIGAGLQLSPNATKVFTALNVVDQIVEQAFEPEALELRIGTSGRRIFSIPLQETARSRWGAGYFHCHRADLINRLSTAVSQRLPDAVHTSSRVTHYEQTDQAICAVLENSQRIEGDLLVGADGIRSTIRTQMHGSDSPRFTGNVAWRATVPIERLGSHVPPPSACVWAGAGRHAVTYRLRGGRLANLVGVVEQDDWQSESWTERGTREQALAEFEGWHPIVTTLIEQADEHYRWALFDREPLPTWSDGRAVLLGDACHPMLPFLAQGAAMAIEDAWVLSRVLARCTTLERAPEEYFRLRIARTTKVQAGSRANMTTFHHRNRLKQLGIYGPMWLAGKLWPTLVHAKQDWLYGYDVLNA